MNNTHAGDICYNRWDMTLFLLPHVTQWIIKLKTSSKFSCRLARLCRVTTVSVVCCSHSQSTQYQVNVIDSGDSHI